MRITTTLFAVFFLMILVHPLKSHEEPPKTLSEKIKKDIEKERLKNQGISLVNVYKYSDPSSLAASSKYLYLQLNYDTRGELIYIKRFNTDGTVADEEKYIFDEKGNMIKDIYFDSTGTETESSQYTFDSLGCVIYAVNYSGGKKESEFYYKKSGSENILQFKKIFPDGKTDYLINYIYDGAIDVGKMIKAVKTSSSGDTLQKVENTYDSRGFIENRNVYLNGSDFSYSYIYMNSISGLPIEIRKILPNEEIEYIQNLRYDLNYNLSEVIVKDNAGFIKAKTEYEYIK